MTIPIQLSSSFTTRKAQIVSAISTPADSYSDKSPKGSIDTPIIDLIDEINAIDGLATTSSCSGRVAVFVEGPKPLLRQTSHEKTARNTGEVSTTDDEDENTKAVTGGPAGKGGGQWLYVSHDPIRIPSSVPPNFFTALCGFDTGHARRFADAPQNSATPDPPRLVKLTFSPLILHVLCATLHHAKSLLAAAINAGFRESGVQSLKALDDPDAGTMIGIRTMGLSFETVIGMVDGVDEGIETYRLLVTENFLAAMFGVVNERFQWNVARRERLRQEIRTHCITAETRRAGWEDKETRRARKREEGLRRQKEKAIQAKSQNLDTSIPAVDGLTVDDVF